MRLNCLHHVQFAVRDLAALEAFANDFGLATVERTDARLLLRTRGGDAYAYVAHASETNALRALAFEVADRASLDAAVASGASPIEPLDLPGGGECVTLIDPDDNTVLLVHGVARRQPEPAYPELLINTPFKKQRFGQHQQPRDRGPARLAWIGHVGLFVKDFAASARWYAETLGLIGSDIYHVPGQPGLQVVGFFRLDHGEDYVDHHILALMQDPRGGCHHISFEAQDFEAQSRTHSFLRSKNYESIWGVGRHPHGSHVFDVWRAPDGARFETFSDTDLFRASDGTNFHDISSVVMDEWVDEGPGRYFA